MQTDVVPTTTWKFFFWFIRPALPLLGAATTVLTFMALAIMAEPILIAQVVDEGLVPGSWAGFWFWISLAAFVALLYPTFFVIGYRLTLIPEARLRQRTGQLLIDHLNVLGADAKNDVSSGEMVHLATEDGRKVSEAITDITVSVMNLVIFLGGILMVWLIQPWLGATLALGVIPTALVAGPLLNRLQKKQSTYRAASGELTSHATDVVGGLRVLRGLGGDALFAKRYQSQSALLRDKGYRVAQSFSWVQGLRHSIPFAFVAAVTWVGANMALNGTISYGELTATFGYASLLIMATARIIDAASRLVDAHVSAGRLASFFQHSPSLTSGGDAEPPPGVLFEPTSGVLIAPGQLTVVVSANVADAIVICRRLARHTHSEATWDDIGLEEVALTHVRSHITLLDHDDYLFAGTLRETLMTGEDDEAAMTALAAAGANDVYTSLGSTLSGYVTEGGRNLSGGQRQRLCLARALRAAPEYLIAIEPTSAIDAHTESLVARNVNDIRQGATTVVVSNSPLWLTHADHVIWLHDGKVRRSGTHHELSSDATYHELTSHEDLQA